MLELATIFGLFSASVILFGVGIGLFTLFIDWCNDVYDGLRYDRHKKFILGQLENYERWLGGEFSDVAEVIDDLRQCVRDGAWSPDLGYLRERLRGNRRQQEADAKEAQS